MKNFGWFLLFLIVVFGFLLNQPISTTQNSANAIDGKSELPANANAVPTTSASAIKSTDASRVESLHPHSRNMSQSRLGSSQPTIQEAEIIAVRMYPELGIKGSSLNNKYTAEYRLLKAQSSTFFNDPSWPIVLAKQLASIPTITAIAPEQASAPSNSLAASNGVSVQAGSIETKTFYDLTVLNVRSAKEIKRDYASYGNAIPASDDISASSGAGGWIRNINFAHQTGLEIAFTTLGGRPNPKEFTLEWFFIASKGNSNYWWVYDNGSMPIPYSAFGHFLVSKYLDETRINEAQYTFTNVPLSGTESTLTVNTLHTTGRLGGKTEGWIVRLKQWKSVAEVRASLSELKDLAISPEGADELDKIAALAGLTDSSIER